MAKQNVLVEAYYSGVWNDITADVFTEEGITLSRGLAEETLEPQPGRISLALNNTDGKYNPNNPASPLYGLIGRNTPLRVTIDGEVHQVGEIAA